MTHLRRLGLLTLVPVALLALARCDSTSDRRSQPSLASGSPPNRAVNLEAATPPHCYVSTSRGNTCWTCHTVGTLENFTDDSRLQTELTFSENARTNPWRHYTDAAPVPVDLSAPELRRLLDDDNHARFRTRHRSGDHANVASFDPQAGLDEHGFSRDGSGWRAVRYQPFVGAFWPGGSGSNEVYVRLPAAFRSANGTPNLDVALVNHAIVESLVTRPAIQPATPFLVELPEIDERRVELDVDRNGTLSRTTQLVGLPETFVGDASDIPAHPGRYPVGTEFLHPVRYLDPEDPDYRATRLRELRHSIKRHDVDRWARLRETEAELDEKDAGYPPVVKSSVRFGALTSFGWQLLGFIEDASGELRRQTEEEHRTCVGCHGKLGVTIDGTFALPRKVPGPHGWRRQSIRGLVDRPQVGHDTPELARFVARALSAPAPNDPSGQRPLTAWWPTPERAELANRISIALRQTQRFDLGRDPELPTTGSTTTGRAELEVESRIDGETGASRRFTDGRLHLDWNSRSAAPAPTRE